jgi:hypothetical protein
MGGEQADGATYRYELEQTERLLVQEISQNGSWQWDVRTNVVRPVAEVRRHVTSP